MGRMTKSRRGKLYIDDAGWGPEVGSIEYGYWVPFGGIHVFISKIGEPGPEPDICTELVETAQRASPTRIQPTMKRAFVGCVHGIGSEPVFEGETVASSDGESSAGETESLYQVQDGVFEGYSDGTSIPEFLETPNHVGIFMAGTQPTLQNSTAAASGPVAGAGGLHAPAGSSSLRFDGCLGDLVDHDSYTDNAGSAQCRHCKVEGSDNTSHRRFSS